MARTTQRKHRLKGAWRHAVAPRYINFRLKHSSEVTLGRCHVWAYRSDFQQRKALERIVTHVRKVAGRNVTTRTVVENGRLISIIVTSCDDRS